MVRFQNQKKKPEKPPGLSVHLCFFWSFFCFLSPALIHFRTAPAVIRKKAGTGIKPQHRLLLCNGRHLSRKSGRLKAHYGLTYDENLFFVDYQTVGANIYPDVTIIEKGAGK